MQIKYCKKCKTQLTKVEVILLKHREFWLKPFDKVNKEYQCRDCKVTKEKPKYERNSNTKRK